MAPPQTYSVLEFKGLYFLLKVQIGLTECGIGIDTMVVCPVDEVEQELTELFLCHVLF